MTKQNKQSTEAAVRDIRLQYIQDQSVRRVVSVQHDLRNDLHDRLVRDRPHLVIRSVLNRMFDKDSTRSRTEGLRLCVCRIDELDSRDEDSRNTAIF